MDSIKPILTSLPKFSKFIEANAKLNLRDFLVFLGTPDILVATADFLCPELILHDGTWFIAEQFSLEAFGLWRSKYDDLTLIQAVMNQINVSVLFRESPWSDAPGFDEVAAQIVSHFWTKMFREKGLTATSRLEDGFWKVTLVLDVPSFC